MLFLLQTKKSNVQKERNLNFKVQYTLVPSSELDTLV